MLGGYYRFYPGDYLRDTSGLSMLEHGAYSLLLHNYYAQNGLEPEKPRLYTICHAKSEEDFRAVDYVVDKYFKITNHKLINNRADKEIAEREQFLAEQSRKGKLGGRPKKKPEIKPGVSKNKAGGFSRLKPEESLPAPAPDPVPALDPTPSPEPKDQSQERMSSPDDLCAAWNRICVSLGKCIKLTAKRKTHAKARLKEYTLPEWEDIFQRIEASPFCKGNGSTGWKASFEWIIKSADNAVKVLEGKYDNNRSCGINGKIQNGEKYKGLGESFEV